jgi:hypothetical protein
MAGTPLVDIIENTMVELIGGISKKNIGIS